VSAEAAQAAAKPATVPSSPWNDAWRRLRKNRMAVICGAIFLFIFLFCFVGPYIFHWITGYDATHQQARMGATAPSWKHWFGTDTLGRDLLVRTMEGGKIAIIVGMTATAVALVVGVTWGAVAAWFGGKVDEVMMRFVDVLYALPSTVFVLVIMGTLQTRSTTMLFLLIGFISWLTMARIVRGQVLSLKNREFVEAARALGVPTGRILFKHIVPNTLGPIIVYTTLAIPGVMLQEAFLSFLGFGVQAPKASWGTLVDEGAKQIVVYPWILIGPGVVMAVTIFALNFLGDGVRDALDPQTRKV
jgi:oligopeptide transport system permease protein